MNFFYTYYIPEKREEIIKKVNELFIELIKNQNNNSYNFEKAFTTLNEELIENYSETYVLGTKHKDRFLPLYSRFYDYKDKQSIMEFLSQKNIYIYDDDENPYTAEEFAKILGYEEQE